MSNIRTRNGKGSVGASLATCAGMFTIVALALAPFFGWVTHLYICFTSEKWGFLIAGAIFFPIGIIHGWGRWFGLW